MVVRVKITE